MLDQEVGLLLNFKGSLKLNEYIQKLNKDEKLLVYVPNIENYSFIIRGCSFIY
jgi:hypothetical protein